MQLTARDMAEGARNLAILREITVRHQHARLRIAGKTVSVDAQTANMLVAVHDALRSDNQPKFEGMLAHSGATFSRLVDFGWGHVKTSRERR